MEPVSGNVSDTNQDFCVGRSPGASAIDLYVFRLDAHDTASGSLSGLLSSDEVTRASSILAPQARDRFVVARASLRRILSDYCDVSPGDLRFEYGRHGKPFLGNVNTPVFFNLSHSGDVGSIAVATDFDVGVDVEVWRDVRPGLAERFFSKAEALALSALNGPERRAAFFRCWTRKEAVIKALGEGMSRPLKSFEVGIDDTARPRVIAMDGESDCNGCWSLFSFSPGAHVSGAVACENRGRQVELRRRELPL